MMPGKSEHLPMTGQQMLGQTVKTAGYNPCVSPYGDSRFPQPGTLRDLELDTDRSQQPGAQRNIPRCMAWPYMLEPMVQRADDLRVKHIHELFHDTMTVMNAVEEKASELLVEYVKKRIIGKIKNNEAKETVLDKITVLLTKDENRRGAMDSSATVAFLPCLVLDP